MASSAGAATAVAAWVGRAGTRPGGSRCARPSTGCATPSPRSTRKRPLPSSATPGPLATTASPSSSTVLRTASSAFCRTRQPRPQRGDRATALKLLEMQRHALLMYTSCGWFFDEVSGIESVQILQYAGRAIQLGEELSGDDLETPFLTLLENAWSNIPEHGSGRRVYEKFVKPTAVGWRRSAPLRHLLLVRVLSARGALLLLHGRARFYESLTAGRSKLVVGRAASARR